MEPNAAASRARRAPPWLWVAGGLLALALTRPLATFGLTVHLLVPPLALALLLWRAARSHARRRLFWLLVLLLVTARSLLFTLQLLGLDAEQELSTTLVATMAGLLFATAGLAAARTVPAAGQRGRREELLDVAATGALVVSSAVYFVAVPGLQVPRQFDAWPATRFLFAVLDLLLVVHVRSARQRATSGRWSALAGWVAGLGALWFLVDAAGCLATLWPEAALARWVGFFDPSLALLPVLWVLATAARPPVATPAEGPLLRPAGWLLLYTAALPAAHISLYAAGWLNPSTRGVRDLVVLAFVALMGALGLVHEVFFDSRRRRIELQRRRAEQLSLLLKNALDSMPLGLTVSDREGRVLFRNRTLVEMLGGDLDPAAGERPTGNGTPRSTTRALLSGLPTARQLDVPRHDAPDLPLLLLSEPVHPPGRDQPIVVTSYEDLSVLRLMEARLRSAEERYKRLTEALPVAVLVLDTAGHLLFANPAGRELFGLSRPSVNAGSLLRQLLEQLGREPAAPAFTLLQASGASLQLQVTSDEVEFAHRPARRLVVRDVSRTLELRRRNREVADLAARGQMSATLAHEIRNPLASITLNLELMSAGRTEAPPAELVALRSVVRQLQQIATGVLELTRGAPLQPAPIDVFELVRSCFGDVTGLPHPPPEGSRTTVSADLQQLRRVAEWLLQNAREASAGEAHIEISVDVEPGWVSVVVSDEGEGVQPDDRRRIFDPFFSTRPGHVGLGLTLAAAIVQRHGGEIQLDEGPSTAANTRFRIVLPRHEAAAH